jgi:hypothetical protein
MLYADPQKNPVYCSDAYVSEDGTKYPKCYPKCEIAELTQVTETPRPTDSSVVVTGFHIDDSFTQVWDTRPKTEEELAEDFSCCKDTKCCAIQSKWEDKINEGFTYQSAVYDMEEATLSIIASRLALTNSKSTLTDPEKTFYKRNRTPTVFADKATFMAFCQALIDERNRLDQKRVSLKKQVNDCASKEEVDAIDIETGW